MDGKSEPLELTLRTKQDLSFKSIQGPLPLSELVQKDFMQEKLRGRGH